MSYRLSRLVVMTAAVRGARALDAEGAGTWSAFTPTFPVTPVPWTDWARVPESPGRRRMTVTSPLHHWTMHHHPSHPPGIPSTQAQATHRHLCPARLTWPVHPLSNPPNPTILLQAVCSISIRARSSHRPSNPPTHPLSSVTPPLSVPHQHQARSHTGTHQGPRLRRRLALIAAGSPPPRLASLRSSRPLVWPLAFQGRWA